jgi:DNA-binding response OmpR family regulator
LTAIQTTVLVVDDDDDIVLLMRDFLEAEGYRVVSASNGKEALAALESTPVDCVLLDVMMPGLSGFEVVRKIREHGEVPVLFLSAKHEDSDKIRGLGLGADDYIVKSATPAEVVARVKAVLRRTRRAEAVAAPAVLDFGRLTVDIRAREARLDGEPVTLTAREFDLLKLLAEHPRQVFDREQLFERLWDSYGDPHTVTVHVARLREKLEKDPSHPALIVTVWGVGYRFEGERRR